MDENYIPDWYIEEQFKEKALDKNKPVKKETQGTLGLFGENPFGGWW